MKKHSVKNERINAEMQRELSRILREEVKDPRIPVMISVTAAQVAPDLKTCKAWISVLGSEADRRHTQEGLQSAASFIRRELAHTLNMRSTPEITFIMDQSIEYGVNMSHRIDEVIAEDESHHVADPSEEEAENGSGDASDEA